MEGVRNDAGTRGGSHPVTSLQKSKTYFGLFQGWAALRLWIWSTGVLHAGTQFCCPCLSHSGLPTHPVYVYPSPRSTLSTMNATGSHLHLKGWPSPASSHSQGVSLPKAFWLQLCLHQLHQLYWEYSPGIAAVPFSIHSEFHLKDSVVKLERDCPFPTEVFSYQYSDFYFHWGRAQNRGAEVFQGEPALDNPCFYASKCNKMRRKKKIPN